jgi:hypothetical protein
VSYDFTSHSKSIFHQTTTHASIPCRSHSTGKAAEKRIRKPPVSDGYGVISNGFGVISNGFGFTSNGDSVIRNRFDVISKQFGVMTKGLEVKNTKCMKVWLK